MNINGNAAREMSYPKQTLRESVDSALEKIGNSPFAVAIFMIAGKINATKRNSKSYDHRLGLFKNSLIGIYDHRSKIEDITADIACFYRRSTGVRVPCGIPQKILSFIKEHPESRGVEIAEHFDIEQELVERVLAPFVESWIVKARPVTTMAGIVVSSYSISPDATITFVQEKKDEMPSERFTHIFDGSPKSGRYLIDTPITKRAKPDPMEEYQI